MRFVRHSALGLIFGTGLAFSGATASVACGTKLDNCETTSTCSGPRSTGGSGGSHAEAGAPADEAGGSGGKGGHGGTSSAANQGGKGGGGGSSDTSARAGSPDDGVAGSDDVAPHDDDHQHGDVHHGDGGESGEGGEGGAPSHGPASDGGRSGSDGRASAGQGSSAGAGGRAGATASGGTAGQASNDTTAPLVTSISPPDGATGVRSDTDIVVTFSEPMDTVSVEQAYQSDDLPPSAVVFSWQNDSTVLTIHPKSPLVYADLTDSTDSARHYAYTFGSTAQDLAGNRLSVSRGTPLNVAFSTLRHVTQSLPVNPGGALLVTQPATGDITREVRCDVAGSYVAAGDDDENGSLLSIVTFDLSSVPASGVEWQSATLTASLGVSGANPYADGRLGKLHVLETTIDPQRFSWTSSMAVGDLGLLATYASQTDGRLDVQSAVTRDYAGRAALGNRSEYVFRFDQATDGNDAKSQARLNCANLLLTLDYLAP